MNPERTLTGSHLDPDAPDVPEFDEHDFVRSARAKALRRNILVSTLAVVCALIIAAAAWIVSERMIRHQYNRIASYVSELVSLSEPNTFVLDQRLLESQLSGAKMAYVTYRPVGVRPVPKREALVEFDVWGGDALTPGESLTWAEPRREFSGTLLVPRLRFLYPGQTGRAVTSDSQERVAQLESLSRTARIRMASAPDSATAELALSFRGLKTADEMRALCEGHVVLNWGAVDVWGASAGMFVPDEGRMVGISFIGPDGSAMPSPVSQLERDLPSRLRFVAQNAPRGTAERCLRSAKYVEENGVKYYGAVVTGPVRELRPLLDNPEVAAAVLGFVVQPWE